MPRAETGEKPILHDCPKCGAPVACGMTNGEDTCWCLALPPALPVPANDSGARCYCRDCLMKLTTASGSLRR
jgi:hypothetical protein